MNTISVEWIRQTTGIKLQVCNYIPGVICELLVALDYLQIFSEGCQGYKISMLRLPLISRIIIARCIYWEFIIVDIIASKYVQALWASWSGGHYFGLAEASPSRSTFFYDFFWLKRLRWFLRLLNSGTLRALIGHLAESYTPTKLCSQRKGGPCPMADTDWDCDTHT